MNARLALLATASLSLLLPAIGSAEASCAPHVLQSPTKFPNRSQLRGQSGVVLLNVTVDAQGRATNAVLARSSGFRLLDRAASESVLKDWLFDVSNCARQDLPLIHTVTVEYRNDEYR